jgi:GNAT superfamily N-acetyltransferase
MHGCNGPPPRSVHQDVPARGKLDPVARARYTTGRLEADSWDAFADLVERNNGIYGGCWCAPNHVEYQRGVSDPRTLKESLVRNGRAHAALVFDEEGNAQGWCQYGVADSLYLKHGREYRKDPPAPAKWRIACIFVDKRHRGEGIARIALEGAIAQIAVEGGGRVEAISETTRGREAQDRFLFSATVELFEDLGFSRERQVGKHAWIVSRTIESRAKPPKRS